MYITPTGRDKRDGHNETRQGKVIMARTKKAKKNEFVELFRVFANGECQVDYVTRSDVKNMIETPRVCVYASILHKNDGIPTSYRIFGDEYGEQADNFHLMAVEESQAIFG